MRTTAVLIAFVAFVAGATVTASAGGSARAPHVPWRHTYAEALFEGRVRNMPVYVTRHKDECGRCERMYREVLTNPDFAKWAADHVIPLVTHDGIGHPEIETRDAEGNVTKECSLYPGISCADHNDASVDVDSPRDDGLVKIPYIELCPNTWLVLPSGEVVRIAEEDQFDVSRTEKRVKEAQQKSGKPFPRAWFDRLAPILRKAEAAIDDDDWHEALTLLASIDKDVVFDSLRKIVQGDLDKIDEAARYAFEDARDDEKTPDEKKRTAIAAIGDALDVPVLGSRVPTYAEVRAWLDAHPVVTPPH
jgi:Thioredoxin-like